ncbi:hypothetical protein D9M69_566950 [compost metagenome]
MNNEPVGRGAGFAHVAHFGRQGAFRGFIEVGVLEHEEGSVAPKLHGGAQDLVGGLAHERLADRCGACEGDFAQPAVFDQGAGDCPCSRRWNDVEDTGGKPCFLHDLG